MNESENLPRRQSAAGKLPEQNLSRMHRHREIMPDNRRYIIYYTFGETDGETDQDGQVLTNGVKENV